MTVVKATSGMLMFSGWLLTAATGQGHAAIAQPDPPELLKEATQLVVVTTPNWDAIDGELQIYERANPRSNWHAVSSKTSIVVGHTGMAWGMGGHGGPPADRIASDPVKKEGDGRAPAGLFKLSSAFGYAPPQAVKSIKLPYSQATASLQCVDDVRSSHYNRLADRMKMKVDWTSAEDMLRPDGAYKWGIFVDHNSNPSIPGGGSCIFLHVWEGPGKGTVGCTAMPEDRIKDLAFWLDPKKHPVLVQIPKFYYAKFQTRWALPVGT